MTIRSDLVIDWDASPRIIEVATPSVDLTVQDLYDTLRSLGAEAIDEPEIIDGSGKEVLSATELVGLTVKLFNAKIKFEDRTLPTDCDIFGGNLVAVDENGEPMNPIQYATNVTVTYAKSSSATMVRAIAEWTQAEKDIVLVATPAIKNKTDNLPSDPADQSLIEAHITTEVDEVKNIIGIPTSPTIADDLEAIEVKTNLIPNDPAIQSLIETRIAEAFAEIKGTPWTDETLKLIKKKIEDIELQPYPSRAHFRS